MAGSDLVQPTQTSMPGGSPWAQDSDGVPGEHPEVYSSVGRKLVTLPGANIPRKCGKAQITQANLDTDVDDSWIAAAGKSGVYNPILLHCTHDSHHRSTQVSYDWERAA